MNFISHDFDHLTQNDEDYDHNFESSSNPCQRYTILYHTIQYLFYAKRQLNQVQAQNQPFTTSNLRELRAKDTSVALGKIASEKYQQLIN